MSVGISGGITSIVTSGKPKAFLRGFGQAILIHGVGHGLFPGDPDTGEVTFGSGDHVGRIIGHGVIGCGFEEAQGRRCSSGFLAAAFSAAVGPLAPQGRLSWKGAAFHLVAGGTGAVLGGGKFADGAVTAAFVYLYNEVSRPQKPGDNDGAEQVDEARCAGVKGDILKMCIRAAKAALRAARASQAAKRLGVTIRKDVQRSGGRAGEYVKDLTGPPNSAIYGQNGRVYVTNSRGEVVRDITSARTKDVVPGRGFGAERAPTADELALVDDFWN